MNLRRSASLFTLLATLSLPMAATAQSVNVTRGILQDRPYTLIYPDTMIASGGPGEGIVINHPDAPLQCTLDIVPVEDTGWTPQSALTELDDAEVEAQWSQTFPGFTIGTKSVTPYQSGDALLYDGQSTDSPMGMPITLVHTEAVDTDRGYVLDCFYATEAAANARPIVDFIIANFSTRSDAECCIGAEPVQEQQLVAPD